MDPKETALIGMANLAAKDAGVSLKAKSESAFWRLLSEITFGSTANTTTTWRKTIWLPANWDQIPPKEQAFTIIHELVHTKQFKKLSWFGFLVLYLLPFPTIFCYGRYWLEARAYEEEFKYRIQLFGEDFHELSKEFAETMASSDYFWGWLFKGYAKKDMEARLFKYL